MDVYSITLTIAFVFGGLAFLAFGIGQWKKSLSLLRFCLFASLISIMLDLTSMLAHFYLDHLKESPSLSMSNFVLQHPSFVIIGFISAILLYLSIRIRKARIGLN